MIHSSIKASSRSVPGRVLFSSVCFPLRRLGRRWGAFPFVTGRITLLISSTRKVYQFPQITTTQSSASATVVAMWQISAVWFTVRTAETKSVLRGTIPQTAVRRSQESIFVTITTALPTWNSESDTVPVTTSKCRIWTLSCLKIFAVSLSSF